MQEEYALFNLLGGTRINYKADTLVQAASIAIQLLLDRDKKWEVQPTEKYSEEDAVMLEGFDNEDGKKLTLLILKKSLADKDKDVFKDWETVN